MPGGTQVLRDDQQKILDRLGVYAAGHHGLVQDCIIEVSTTYKDPRMSDVLRLIDKKLDRPAFDSPEGRKRRAVSPSLHPRKGK